MQHQGFFSRLAALVRGMFRSGLDNAELGQPEVVYANAIREHSKRRDKLMDAVSRLVYLRNKHEAQLIRNEEHLGLLEQSVQKALRDGLESRAEELIRKRRVLRDETVRIRAEHLRLGEHCADAKENLKELATAVRKLKSERDEMMARKVNAHARIEVASILDTTRENGFAADDALENVRESILRLEHRANLQLGEDSASGESEDLDSVSFVGLRREAEDVAASEELDAMRMRLGLSNKNMTVAANRPEIAKHIAQNIAQGVPQ